MKGLIEGADYKCLGILQADQGKGERRMPQKSPQGFRD